MPDFRDVSVTLTSNELTVVSDILRRQPPSGLFTGKREFQTAIAKLETAKSESYGWDADPGDDLRWAAQAFPVDIEREKALQALQAASGDAA